MTEPTLISIRGAVPHDVPELWHLCQQLGFEISESQLADNLMRVLRNPEKTVLVGTDDQGKVLAWAGLELRALLEAPPMVEITGFVVDEAVRGHRVGSLLLAAAEGWASRRGVSTVVFRSNVIRHEAHHFYLRHGYFVSKTQHVLMKRLSETP
ncbi:MAG: GNAT family N-acetyltransferase [Neisseriaceae bacterium]|jgi:GNAT superfamily N-acetyltransferase|nr:hypothetical protein [Pseudomonadota bacterium]RTL00601.1 MAG: GNAT family N-acetyltransferase [Neisseriaceae bacterium]